MIQLTSREAWVWILVLLALGAIIFVLGKTLWQIFVASVRGGGGRPPSLYSEVASPQQGMVPPPGYGSPPPQGYGQQNGSARMRGPVQPGGYY